MMNDPANPPVEENENYLKYHGTSVVQKWERCCRVGHCFLYKVEYYF